MKEYQKIKTDVCKSDVSVQDFIEILKTLIDIGILEIVKGRNLKKFKVKPQIDELKIILEEEKFQNIFKHSFQNV